MRFADRYIILNLFVIIFATVAGVPSSVLAATSPLATTPTSITMSPSSTQLSIMAGTSISKSFEIANNGSDTAEVTLNALPYSVRGSQYIPQLSPMSSTINPASWVHFNTSTLSVGAYKLSTIPYTLTVPDGTPPGGYYAVLLASVASTGSAASHIQTYARVGNILYISVGSNLHPDGVARALARPLVLISSSLPLSLDVKNSGNIHFTSSVTTTVEDILNHASYHHADSRLILPRTTRTFEDVWTLAAPIGLYKISQTATVAGKPHILPISYIFVVAPAVAQGALVLLIIILTSVNGRLLYRKLRHHKQ